MKETSKKNLMLIRMKENLINFLVGLYGVILNVFPVAVIIMTIVAFKLIKELKGYYACMTFLGCVLLSFVALKYIIMLGKFYILVEKNKWNFKSNHR